jgi:hypothetical protein
MGHGGADFFTMNNFVRAIANDDPTLVGTGVQVQLSFYITEAPGKYAILTA